MKATYLWIAAIVIAATWLPVERVQAQSEDLNAQVVQLYRQGRYGEAIPIATRALQQVEAQSGTEQPITATSLNNLALLYKSMGRYDDALPLYRRALAIHEKALGPEHARDLAMAAPIPLEAPVTTATLPVSLLMTE